MKSGSPEFISAVMEGMADALGAVPALLAADSERDAIDAPSDLMRAVAYFRDNRAAISEQYAERFVAILDDEVKDSDEDFAALEKRMRSFHRRSPYLVYAAAVSLFELRERFRIDGPVDIREDRASWQRDAADDVMGQQG